MTRTILLVENERDFRDACERLKDRGAFRSAVPPFLIESSVDIDQTGLRDLSTVRVFRDDVPEEVLSELPFNHQLALRAYLRTKETVPESTEGARWDSPDYEAPGRPEPEE